MKILITGGTGLVGKKLQKVLSAKGHSLNLATRQPEKFNSSTTIKYFKWNSVTDPFPIEELKDIDVVINLMGESIADKRWSESQKKKLRDSRIEGTKKLISAINNSSNPVQTIISASAIGFYAANKNENLSEESKKGDGFLSDLCHEWESEVYKINDKIRKVIFRIGVVLDKNGGALGKLLPLFKLGLGGPVGSGQQIMSWIHIDDLCNAIAEAVSNSEYEGVFNATAPAPVSNKEFTKALAKALSRPAFFVAPPIGLKIAMGEMSSIVLDSHKVLPKKLIANQFSFKFKDIDSALVDIVTSK